MIFHWRLWAALLVVLVSYPAVASPTTITAGVFDITFYHNGDTNGKSMGIQDWTGEQMNDVISAVDAWSSHIGNTPGRQINVHVFWNEMDSTSPALLGGSTSYRLGDGTTQWTLAEYIWKEGNSPAQSSYGYDTLVQYDVTAAGGNWNFGADAPTSTQMDFRTIVTHELGHALGFKSSYDYSFDDWGWLPGYGYKGITAWDKNLIDSQGNKPHSGSTGSPDNFNERDNPVYWDGSKAREQYGNQNVPVYAPNPWKRGSSLSHLDEGQLGNLLMSPFFNEGQVIRQPSELEWAMMEDMGWMIIPEPATLLIFGLGSLVLVRNRK